MNTRFGYRSIAIENLNKNIRYDVNTTDIDKLSVHKEAMELLNIF